MEFGAGTSPMVDNEKRHEGGDRAKLSGLPRLADTADELNAIANSLGAARGDIHLRADASETVVKRTPLADYRLDENRVPATRRRSRPAAVICRCER
jgi:hypothetical protein